MCILKNLIKNLSEKRLKIKVQIVRCVQNRKMDATDGMDDKQQTFFEYEKP